MRENLKVHDVTDHIVVGRFGRPHGIRGYITVHAFAEPRDNILSYPQWFTQIGHQWTPLKLLDTESRLQTVVVLVEGYPTREAVAGLTNLEIAVPAEALPALPKGEYYWRELMGMTVVNVAGEVMGVVTEMMATGAHDILVVTGKKRHLIPYRLGAVVLDVCEAKGQITVDWDDSYL